MEAFESRLQYEKTHHNQIVSANQFQETIKILLNGFIVSTITDLKTAAREYSFINPSLADFIIGHVKESYQERKAILSSIVFIDQLNRFDPDTLRLPVDDGLQQIIFQRLHRGTYV